MERICLTNLSFDQIESNIRNSVSPETIYSALSIIMTICHRFKDRMTDFNYLPFKEKKEFCVMTLAEFINNNRFNSIKELLNYLMKSVIINRHELIATEKQYQGRDGFLYEKVYEHYFNRGGNYTIDVALPGLRIVNVLSVLKDLGKI